MFKVYSEVQVTVLSQLQVYISCNHNPQLFPSPDMGSVLTESQIDGPLSVRCPGHSSSSRCIET